MAQINIVRRLCSLTAFAARFPYAPAKRVPDSVTDRPGHDRRYAIDATRLETELRFLPRETFETGLDKTVAWYLANESWWRGSLAAAPAHRQEVAP